MEKGACIKHFNLIVISKLYMKEKSLIRRGNILKGCGEVILGVASKINQFNKVTAGSAYKSTLSLGTNTIVGSNHLLELTSNVTIGDYSILAGAGTQIWTHGFYFSKAHPPKRWRVDSEVIIKKNVYVGTRCVITPGVVIQDNITIGAGSVISKNLDQQGLYVNQRLRFIEFDPDVAIHKFKKINDDIYEK